MSIKLMFQRRIEYNTSSFQNCNRFFVICMKLLDKSIVYSKNNDQLIFSGVVTLSRTSPLLPPAKFTHDNINKFYTIPHPSNHINLYQDRHKNVISNTIPLQCMAPIKLSNFTKMYGAALIQSLFYVDTTKVR